MMDMENERNIMKLDIEAVRLSDVGDQKKTAPKETYKPIPEYPVLGDSQQAFDGAAVKNSNMVRENNDHIEDGAGDAMLATSEKEQLALGNEVKFISAEHKNGDAKIDIGNLEKAFTGMTKEELMRYANDPFWVRLRWIFFLLFWGLWIAMLVGAILIIVGAPKCAAPTPLAWFKQGPLVRLPHSDRAPSADELQQLSAINARGAIFTLPADDTYRVGRDASVDAQIRAITDALLAAHIQPIADVTPNFVLADDELYTAALSVNATAEQRAAFIFEQSSAPTPNNWLSLNGSSAWQSAGTAGEFALAQFGAGRRDLQLNSTLGAAKFTAILQQLSALGVTGIRLHNAKHFIVGAGRSDEKLAADRPGAAPADPSDYAFWLHTHSTYQPGLAQLLEQFASTWHNATKGAGFLSVADNLGRVEAFKVPAEAAAGHSRLTIDLPIAGALPHTLATAFEARKAEQLALELQNVFASVGNSSWVQWVYDSAQLAAGHIGRSEYSAFVWLLPGVPVAELSELSEEQRAEVEVEVAATTVAAVSVVAVNASTTTTEAPAAAAKVALNMPTFLGELEALRQTPSYMHGSFRVHTDAEKSVVAYSRIKSGNPGYLVAYNPSNSPVNANLTAGQSAGLPEQLTVALLSNNYKIKDVAEKSKVQLDAIPIDAGSVVILTYVPKSAE